MLSRLGFSTFESYEGSHEALNLGGEPGFCSVRCHHAQLQKLRLADTTGQLPSWLKALHTHGGLLLELQPRVKLPSGSIRMHLHVEPRSTHSPHPATYAAICSPLPGPDWGLPQASLSRWLYQEEEEALKYPTQTVQPFSTLILTRMPFFLEFIQHSETVPSLCLHWHSQPWPSRVLWLAMDGRELVLSPS